MAIDSKVQLNLNECSINHDNLYTILLQSMSKQYQNADRDIEELICGKILNKLGYPQNVLVITRQPMNMCKSWYLNGKVIAWMKLNNNIIFGNQYKEVDNSVNASVNTSVNVEYWIDEEYL